MTDYEQAYRDLRTGVEALADRMLCPWDQGAVERFLASSAPATASEDATLSDSVTDSVTSSDGDRGLSEERRAILLALALADGQEWHGWANASEHTAEMMYGKQADAVERILAARAAQPEGVERVEWGVSINGHEPDEYWDDDNDLGDAKAVAERDLDETAKWLKDREPGATAGLVRRTVTEFAPVVGPWEVVGDE